ncbi:hypothetical protein L6164_020144 [Bauhinia variegata]|uniref:Uncharacterized protein n=1 Tax=Bauhinia variegata TaxID=167791 RepID=A0ACB9MU40_BAUVA|nr:hypothetical protein L6164_020144 [Bauhinia variegata]
MDRRGWPWKKKSSDKTINADKPASASESLGSSLSSLAHLGDQDKGKIHNYVQISMDSYKHMSTLEGQVQNLEDKVKTLEEKLSATYSELSNKDNLVKQHAKVAEEAVTGWEKADAEVISLRRDLESVTLSKLAVDDRASHVDSALKECMRQIRNVKEESERKLQDAILIKTKQWEKVKLELEAKIAKLEEGLLQAADENAALLRSLQASSNKIMKMEEEKSQAEDEIKLSKESILSYEKEISSLKYELHIVSKELDIRNEEKNISMRSAEIANKQHAEGVKKITKLEAECQRLRALVRKKLPGPAALAQMKLEVDSSDRDINEPHIRKSSIKGNNLRVYSIPDSSFGNLQQSHNEFLTKKLMAMEEETKALKEALDTSNTELQASRNRCAKTVGRLKSLEAEMQAFKQKRSSQNSNLIIDSGFPPSRITNNPPSIKSISEDGLGDAESLVESCAASISDLSDSGRCENIDKSEKHMNTTILELMDDFLEMEKMACLPENARVDPGIPSKADDSGKSCVEYKESHDVPRARDLHLKHWNGLGLLPKQDSSVGKFSMMEREDESMSEKDGMVIEHAQYLQDLKKIQLELQEKEQLLEELKIQLSSSQKSYNLAEVQLKCMAESYKSLETHTEELKTENKILKQKIEELQNELVGQKQCHLDALARCKEIQDKMQRDEKSLVRASNSISDSGINTKDMELAAAEKKLAECQETLYLLGRQLQALCPQIEINVSQHSKRFQKIEMLVKPDHCWSSSHGSCNSNELDQVEAYSVSSDIQGMSEEFSLHNCGSTSCLSDTEENLS